MAAISSPGSTLSPPPNITASDDPDHRYEAKLDHPFYVCMSILVVVLSVMTNTFNVYILNRTDTLHETERLLYKALAVSDINTAASRASFIYNNHITNC